MVTIELQLAVVANVVVRHLVIRANILELPFVLENGNTLIEMKSPLLLSLVDKVSAFSAFWHCHRGMDAMRRMVSLLLNATGVPS